MTNFELPQLPKDLFDRVACAELRVARDQEFYYATIDLVGTRLIAVKSEDTLMALRDDLCTVLATVHHQLQQATAGLRMAGVADIDVMPSSSSLIDNGPFARSGLGQGSWKT